MLYHGQLFRDICYEILIQEPLERGPKLEDPDYKPRVGYLLPLQHVLIRASSYQLGSSWNDGVIYHGFNFPCTQRSVPK